MNFRISRRVADKLRTKHQVTPAEVRECFFNREGPSLEDPRLDHRTDPPTYWFMAPTDAGRILKVVYVEYPADGDEPAFFAIKTAYEPVDNSAAIYAAHCN
jgi:hypothetical protein